MTATPKHPDNRENGANTMQKYNFFLNVPNKMKQKKMPPAFTVGGISSL